MHDSKVIAACMASSEAFDKVKGHVDANEFTPMGGFWWPLVVDWYTNDDQATGIDPSLLKERGLRKVDGKLEETMVAWFDSLPEVPSATNVVHDLLEVKRHARGHELSAAIADGEDRRNIKRLLAEYDELVVATELDNNELIKAGSVRELGTILSDEAKLSLHPKTLNDRTDGGALPGDFIIIFGRPEMGKTLFCVNLVSHWLRKGSRVLYIGNEDKIEKIQGRIQCNLSNMDKDQVEKWRDEADKRSIAHGIDDRLFLYRMTPGTVSKIEELIIKHEPDVLVLDQIRNIGGAGDGLTSRLNQVAIDVRNLLGKHQVIGLGVTQANAGEHGKSKPWLELDDVDSSRTGLPAQADLLIGIGGDDNMVAHNTRALTLCKNKLSGNHDGFTVKVDKARNKLS